VELPLALVQSDPWLETRARPCADNVKTIAEAEQLGGKAQTSLDKHSSHVA